jgi:hypothetical protein
MTDYAMRSRHQGHGKLETPMLDIAYTAAETVNDWGLGKPLPWPKES